MTVGPKHRRTPLPGTPSLRSYGSRLFCIFPLIFIFLKVQIQWPEGDRYLMKMSTGRTKENGKNITKAERG